MARKRKHKESEVEKYVHGLPNRGGGPGNAEYQWGCHQHVDIDRVEISDRPNRAHIDQKAPEFLELVESIRATRGVIQPILVRQGVGDRFELVAGERRLLASKAAGRGTIAAIVREMSDAEAAAYQLTENTHRSDLTPLEEAGQVRALLDAGTTTAEIAKLLGRTQRWVQRRASLTGLSAKWLNAASARDCAFGLWPAAALERIARLPEDLQDRLFKDWSQSWRGRDLKTPAPDPKDLDKAIGNVTCELKRARWGLDDATLVPKAGACSECKRRAGQQPLLWDGLADTDMADPKASKADVCLDAGCWEKKTTACIKAKAAELKAEHGKEPVLVREDYSSRDAYPTSVNHYDVKRCKKTDKGARPAVLVDGLSAGGVTWVKSSSHGGAVSASRKQGPTPLKERRKKLQERRDAWVIDEVQKALECFGFAELQIDDTDVETVLLRLVATFGTEPMGGTFTEFKQSEGDEWEHVWEELWGAVKLNIPCNDLLSARDVAEFLGLGDKCPSFDDLVEKAARELPEPKSWAKLAEDGTPKTATAKGAKTKGKTKKAKPQEPTEPEDCGDCVGENGCADCAEPIENLRCLLAASDDFQALKEAEALSTSKKRDPGTYLHPKAAGCADCDGEKDCADCAVLEANASKKAGTAKRGKKSTKKGR